MKKFLSILLVSIVALGSMNVQVAQESSTPESYKVPKRAYIVPALKIGGGVLSCFASVYSSWLCLYLIPKERRCLEVAKNLVASKFLPRPLTRDDAAQEAFINAVFHGEISNNVSEQLMWGGVAFLVAASGIREIFDGVMDIKNLRNRKAKSYYCIKSRDRDVYIIVARDENTQRSKVVKIIPATEK